MQAYSLDLRVRVLAAVDADQPRAEIARRFSVSMSWIRRLVQRRRETGSIEPKPHAGPMREGRPRPWTRRIASGCVNWSTNNRTPRSSSCAIAWGRRSGS